MHIEGPLIRPRRPRLATAAGLVLLVAAAGLSADAADQQVVLRGNRFEPSRVTIRQGETVTWAHVDGNAAHSVTADDGSFDSSPSCTALVALGCMRAGETFSRRFDQPGTFRYYCRVHGGPGGSGMSGVVAVEAPAPSPSPSPRASPGPSPIPSPSPSPSPALSPSPSPSPEESPTESPGPSPSPTPSPTGGRSAGPPAGGGGPSTPLVVALLAAAIAAASGAGLWWLRKGAGG